MVSSPLQNDLLDPPSKSFYRTAILPKFHLTLPKSFFVLTWRFANPYVGIFSSQRGWGSFRPISMGRPFRAIYPVGRWLLAVSRWLASLVALVLLVALALRLAPISSF